MASMHIPTGRAFPARPAMDLFIQPDSKRDKPVARGCVSCQGRWMAVPCSPCWYLSVSIEQNTIGNVDLVRGDQ
eukprot:10897071-Heterocapsa_arctica.AAC.1